MSTTIPIHNDSINTTTQQQQYLLLISTQYRTHTASLRGSLQHNLLDIDRLSRLATDVITSKQAYNTYSTHSNDTVDLQILEQKYKRQYDLFDCVIQSEVDKLHNQLILLYKTVCQDISNATDNKSDDQFISDTTIQLHDLHIYLHHNIHTLIQLSQYCDTVLSNQDNFIQNSVVKCIQEELVVDIDIETLVLSYNNLYNILNDKTAHVQLVTKLCRECNHLHHTMDNINNLVEKYHQKSNTVAAPVSTTEINNDQIHSRNVSEDGVDACSSVQNDEDHTISASTADIKINDDDDDSGSDTTSNKRRGAMGLGKSCHQCKTKKPAHDLLFCTNNAHKTQSNRICRKKYCKLCLCWYSVVIENVTAEMKLKWRCPACLGFCTCANCQRIRKNGPRSKVSQKRKTIDKAITVATPPPVLALPTPPTLVPARAVSVSSTDKSRGYSVPVAVNDQLQYIQSLPTFQHLTPIDRTHAAQHLIQQQRSSSTVPVSDNNNNNNTTPANGLNAPPATFGQNDTNRSVTQPVFSQQWQQMSLQQQYIQNYQQHANYNFPPQHMYNNIQQQIQNNTQLGQYFPLAQQNSYTPSLLNNDMLLKPADAYNVPSNQQAMHSLANTVLNMEQQQTTPSQQITHDISNILRQ